jgi:signal peptidase I
VNFALFLFSLLSVTGLVWLLEKLVLRDRRQKDAKQPWWVEYSVSFFPVILVVFLLRSFLVEPFKIPSGSMIPTLLIGAFILVNKYTYGIRLPVLNVKVFDVGSPKRGDVMVFRYPVDPSLDYIKRVVGLPGDRIEYRDKRLWINGEEVPRRRLAKRHGDTRLATLRAAGVTAERLVGLLAWSCGLIDRPEPVLPRELLTAFDLAKLSPEPWVFGEEQLRMLTD